MKQSLLISILFFSSFSFSFVGPTKNEVIDYSYEVNTAPFAFFANWSSLDIIKYDRLSADSGPNSKFGYGVAAISYVRNQNDLNDTFPSRGGWAFGIVAIEDEKENYFGSHVFYEKYERYRNNGSLVQEREGLRGNFVIGGKEFFKNNYALKFGWGIELQAHKIREFDEKNRNIQTNYYSVQLNPLFFEFKLAGLF